VSGAAVDAFAERLKGEIGGSTAYDLATTAGNGSLRPLTSQAPILSSSVPLATGLCFPYFSKCDLTFSVGSNLVNGNQGSVSMGDTVT
jgi:hypothetical protein